MDKFGNVITEQSYYRTGGDVAVIDREDIENHAYVTLAAALNRIPGVNVRTPGYRGGEYGYDQTHSIVAINGDDRVIVLVDGRRVDNTTSGAVARSGARSSKALVDINQVVNMLNVEKIEVIKGPGASAYGADATGGVINIITRKGGKETTGAFDFSLGSWGRKHKKVNVSSTNEDGTLRTYFGGAWEKGGDNWYRDGLTDTKYRYVNTYYDETSYNLRVDYDINKDRTVTLAYNHMDAHDGYPLTAPYRKYMTAEEWARIKKDYFENDKYGNTNNPGYRNLWYMWAWTGGYTEFKKNDINLTYSLGNDGPIERFVRVYHQDGAYWGSFGSGDDPQAPTPDTPEWYEWAKARYRSQDWKSWYSKERNEGVQVQWGKTSGIHQVITSWTFDSSHYWSWNRKKNAFANTDRKTVWGFVQDKISINDKWQVAPALRYTNTGSVKRYSEEGEQTSASDSASIVTGALATQYALSDSLTAYASWSQVFRPLKASDYTMQNGAELAHLKDEEGNVWTAGIRKNWKDLYFTANYSKTKMSNAVARVGVKEKGAADITTKFLNAKQDKEAVNFSLQKKFDKHWRVGLSYTYMKDKWTAKELGEAELIINEMYGNINTAINQLRPANFYTANISYESARFFADYNVNYYTGCSTIAFTSNKFLVMDLNMNYKWRGNVNVYASINNITDEAWETTFTPYLAIGAWPQPARHYAMGITYKF